jgi:hypothetical protein
MDVECTHCGIRTTKHVGSGKRVRYFQCPSCYRWVADCYSEVLQADTKFRATPIQDGTQQREFTEVRDRLERWLTALDDQDPYRLLGVSPLDPEDVVRSRYRELALQRHPDRGGSEDAMRELNAAYERIVSHRKRRRATQLPEGRPAAVAVPLAARAR